MKKSEIRVLKALLAVFVVIVVVFAVLINKKPNITEYLNVERRSGEHITISVDSPFLFSLVSDLTDGANADISLNNTIEKTDFQYSIYNEDYKPSFDNIIADVILYGENFLHDIDLTDYENVSGQKSVLPAGYSSRKPRRKAWCASPRY